MLSDCQAVATVPVGDLDKARSFYGETLGLKLRAERQGELEYEAGAGSALVVFASQGRPAGTHTQVTFMCAGIDAEVAELRARGVRFEEFDMPGIEGRDGIYDLGHERAAWFRDPEGNLLAIGEPRQR